MAQDTIQRLRLPDRKAGADVNVAWKLEMHSSFFLSRRTLKNGCGIKETNTIHFLTSWTHLCTCLLSNNNYSRLLYRKKKKLNSCVKQVAFLMAILSFVDNCRDSQKWKFTFSVENTACRLVLHFLSAPIYIGYWSFCQNSFNILLVFFCRVNWISIFGNPYFRQLPLLFCSAKRKALALNVFLQIFYSFLLNLHKAGETTSRDCVRVVRKHIQSAWVGCRLCRIRFFVVQSFAPWSDSRTRSSLRKFSPRTAPDRRTIYFAELRTCTTN